MKHLEWLAYLKQFLGLPYIWGGSNIKIGLDCSGFCQIGLAWLHLDPPGDQTADGLMRHFAKKENGKKVKLSEAQLGDMVFYGKTRATHIVFALDDAGMMIEAGGGGSKNTTAAYSKARGACVRIARIDRRKDIICVLRPKGLPW